MTATLQRQADRYTDALMRQIDDRLAADEAHDDECARIAAQIVTSERRMLAMIDSSDIDLFEPILSSPRGERMSLLQAMVREFVRSAAFERSWESRALAKHLAECSSVVDAEAKRNMGGE